MTRIGRLFETLKRDGRKGLIAYITAGDPAPDRTPALVEALLRGGADLIELGVPFSDPIADGPVIQRGGERALKAGTTLKVVLEIAARIRERSQVPLLLFTYLNPVLRYGLERLAKDAAGCGIDPEIRNGIRQQNRPTDQRSRVDRLAAPSYNRALAVVPIWKTYSRHPCSC